MEQAERARVTEEWKALAAEFRGVRECNRVRHATVRFDRVKERACQTLVRSIDLLKGEFIPDWSEWLGRVHDRLPDPGPWKRLAEQTWDIQVQGLVLDYPKKFNKRDEELLADMRIRRRVVPWPEWWDEKSEEEKRLFETLEAIHDGGELRGMIEDEEVLKELEVIRDRDGGPGWQMAKRGSDVLRHEREPVPNEFAAGKEPDESDKRAQVIERADVHARACELLGDLCRQGGGDDLSSIRPHTREADALVASVKLNATETEPVTIEDLARKAGGSTKKENYAKVVAGLVRRGAMGSKAGRRGGCWPTKSGRRRAVELTKSQR